MNPFRYKWCAVFVLLAMTLFVTGAFAQERSDIPGVTVSTSTNQGVEVMPSSPPGPGSPRSPEEYGELSANYVLSNLGSSTAHVSVPHNSLFGQNVDGTLEAWIYPTSVSTNAIIASKGATSNQSFLWGIESSAGKLYLRIGSTVYLNPTGGVIPLNAWSHVAVTWQAGSNFIVTFYINGAQTGSPDTTTATWDLNTDSVFIGGSQNWPGEYFQGSIDEVRFWGPARSLAQIRDNRFTGLGAGYLANAGGAITSGAQYFGLVASWTFNHTGAAYEDINILDGSYMGGAGAVPAVPARPIPYNLALLLAGGPDDQVVVPYNSVFDQNFDGTVEAWVKPTGSHGAPYSDLIISKGSGGSEAFLTGVRWDSLVFLRIGSSVFLNSDGDRVPFGKWSHVAVVWTGGPSTFTVTFYINGKQSGTPVVSAATWNLATDSVRIGGSQFWTSESFIGYLDEVRFWQNGRTLTDIQNKMFVSGRALMPDANLYAVWNFEGNLLNFGSTAGIGGTFENGGSNTARFSAYTDENLSGATRNIPHTTVLNRGGGAFPNGYAIRAPWKTIPDNTPAGINDTITIGTSIAVTSVEAFISIEHTWVSDLVVTLRAPNGQVRTLLNGNGSSRDNILTFFNDAFAEGPTSTTYLAPWGFIQGFQVMGDFGGANTAGDWILNVSDNAAADIGPLKGWGIRFNNTTGVQQITSNVPGAFELAQNFPNPFNPSTEIQFAVPRQTQVTLKIYDILGREVTTLVDEVKAPGTYRARWDASFVATGVYFYRIKAGEFTQVKKMMLVK